jgi:hypothetical protein
MTQYVDASTSELLEGGLFSSAAGIISGGKFRSLEVLHPRFIDRHSNAHDQRHGGQHAPALRMPASVKVVDPQCASCDKVLSVALSHGQARACVWVACGGLIPLLLRQQG